MSLDRWRRRPAQVHVRCITYITVQVILNTVIPKTYEHTTEGIKNKKNYTTTLYILYLLI